jgi:hypothetical protein
MFKGLLHGIKNNAHYIMLGVVISYLIFYSIYTFSSLVHESLKDYDKIFNYLSNISLLVFTAGIFSAVIKYYQFLGVFQEEFKKVVLSEDFDKKLEEKLTQITFSEEYLLEQSNIESIWETVTLSRYNRQFPELYEKLKKRIINQFFKKNNILYYYKNFQITYSIELDEADSNIIHITERASYTIMRPSLDEFEWDFYVAYLDKQETFDHQIEFTVTNLEEVTCTVNDITEERKDNGNVIVKATKKFHDRKEYHVERMVKISQNLEEDRVYSFASDRIIDDLSFKVKLCDKLNVFVSPAWDVKLYKDETQNGTIFENMSYINRDLFLPGEKFKLFIYKKDI